jgi:hypothetical protein
MSRATLEVADIIRAAGDSFWNQHGALLVWPHRKVLDAIARCRTASLGGHRDRCVRYGYQAISYNSCRSPAPPACSLHRSCRRPECRRVEMDCLIPTVLPAGKGAQSRVSRQVLSGPPHLYKDGKLQLHGTVAEIDDAGSFNRFLDPLNKDWVVYAKPPFGGPDLVLNYLSRHASRSYFQRVGMLHQQQGRDHRICSFEEQPQ